MRLNPRDRNVPASTNEMVSEGLNQMNQKIILSIALFAIVVLTLVSGLGFYQISELQNQISELQTQNSELQDQVGDLQDQNNELQDQNKEFQDQKSELQNQLTELEKLIASAPYMKIKKFDWTGGWFSLGQVTFYHNFEVTVENMGDNDVSLLTLSLQLKKVGTSSVITGYTKQINIRAKQTLKISDLVRQQLPVVAFDVCVITLSLDDVLVDQWTRDIDYSLGH